VRACLLVGITGLGEGGSDAEHTVGVAAEQRPGPLGEGDRDRVAVGRGLRLGDQDGRPAALDPGVS
jgi:hypothetical protein